MKKCSKCGRELPLSEYNLVFPKKQDGKLRPDCKFCVRERSKERYIKDPESHLRRMSKIRDVAIQKAKEYKANFLVDRACIDCGETDPIVLDFDHVIGKKICEVSKMISKGYRLWRIQEEILKCQIRCANCHRRITYKRRLADMV